MPPFLPALALAGLLAATPPAGVWLVPSVARVPGAGGAFWTSDLVIANLASAPAAVTVKLLPAGSDGRSGPEVNLTLAAGETRTVPDVVKELFGLTEGFGALRVSSTSTLLGVSSQTWTAALSGGTYGQGAPAVPSPALVRSGSARLLTGIREDAAFRTNLVLASASEEPVSVDLTLLSGDGRTLGSSRVELPPLGMRQLSRVARALGAAGDVAGATLLLATSSPGAFAAQATAIDNATNDPRTLLPSPPISRGVRLLPGVARVAALGGGAFWTTDLTLANPANGEAVVTLQLLPGDGSTGQTDREAALRLPAGQTRVLGDVVRSLFGRDSGYGSLRIRSSRPDVVALAETSTPGGGGTYGQSAAEVPERDWIRAAAPGTLAGVREDGAFRTNLVLASAVDFPFTVSVSLLSASGATLARKGYELPARGGVQVTRVVRDLGLAGDVSGARLVLSTDRTLGAFTASASVIDAVTNDPRSLPLARSADPPLLLELPLAREDASRNAFGLVPFAAHVGEHIEDGGHPGWDLEVFEGRTVRAAAGGDVRSVALTEPSPPRYTVQLEHERGSRRWRTVYTNLERVEAAIVPGASVTSGQPLGAPGGREGWIGSSQTSWWAFHFQLDDLATPDDHTGVGNASALSPEPYLSGAGLTAFDAVWGTAAYGSELAEPFVSCQRTLPGSPYPVVRVWSRLDSTGDGPERLEMRLEKDRQPPLRYAFLSGSGAVLESGSVDVQVRPSPPTLDLQPLDALGKPSGGRRLGLFEVVDGVLRLKAAGPGSPRPASLEGATVYVTY